LWRDNFEMIELTENRRQEGHLDWVAHLNAVRLGGVGDAPAFQAAVGALHTRLSYRQAGPLGPEVVRSFNDVPRIYPLNDMVNAYNMHKLQQAHRTQILTIAARDAQIMPDGRMREPVGGAMPSNTDECGGLALELQVRVGARVMLRRNIDIPDGLVNGAVGEITALRYPDGTEIGPSEGEVQVPWPGGSPAALMVTFDNAAVGKRWRASNNLPPCFANGGDCHSPIAIGTVSARFTGNRATHLVRRQFPVALAWAMTMHRVQGLSMDRAVVHLGHSIFDDGQAYVALSRVRSLEGVLIEGLVVIKLQMASAAVTREYARLRGRQPATAAGAAPVDEAMNLFTSAMPAHANNTAAALTVPQPPVPRREQPVHTRPAVTHTAAQHRVSSRNAFSAWPPVYDTWPPSGVRAGETASYLYMPLLLDAVEAPHPLQINPRPFYPEPDGGLLAMCVTVYGQFQGVVAYTACQVPGHEEPTWSNTVLAYRKRFADYAPPITFATMQQRFDSAWHLPGGVQEQYMEMCKCHREFWDNNVDAALREREQVAQQQGLGLPAADPAVPRVSNTDTPHRVTSPQQTGTQAPIHDNAPHTAPQPSQPFMLPGEDTSVWPPNYSQWPPRDARFMDMSFLYMPLFVGCSGCKSLSADTAPPRLYRL
jgi:hypothetical protein